MTSINVKRLSAILICSGLVFTILFVALPTPVNALTVRGPIHILGNSAFTSANGVVSGTGTYADPYIIKGWDINAATNHGIWIEYTTAYFIVENCFVHGGAPNYHGIYLYQAYNGRIENVESSWNLFGITLINSGSENHGNTISTNYVHENWWAGMYVSFSNFNKIDNNIFTQNGNGLQAYTSNNNTLTNNDSNQNDNYGFALYSSYNNTLISNRATTNTNGFYLNLANSNTFTDNMANKNSNIGFYLYNTRENNVFKDNTANNNQYGFYVYGANHNVFTGNQANNNAYYGFYINFYSSYNEFTSNTANNNQYGFYLYIYAQLNYFIGNTANFNQYGFELYYYAQNNELISNTASNNVYYGFYIGNYYCAYNVLTGNTANNNQYGFYLYGSYNNTLNGNSATFNQYGITLKSDTFGDSAYNHLASNQAQENKVYDWQPAGTGNTYNYNDYTTHNP